MSHCTVACMKSVDCLAFLCNGKQLILYSQCVFLRCRRQQHSGELWQRRYGQGQRPWHLTCARKLTSGSEASKRYHKTAHLLHVKGFSSELLTWGGTTHVVKHYATSNLWGNGEDNYVSATLRSFFLTPTPFQTRRVKAVKSKLTEF